MVLNLCYVIITIVILISFAFIPFFAFATVKEIILTLLLIILGVLAFCFIIFCFVTLYKKYFMNLPEAKNGCSCVIISSLYTIPQLF